MITGKPGDKIELRIFDASSLNRAFYRAGESADFADERRKADGKIWNSGTQERKTGAFFSS